MQASNDQIASAIRPLVKDIVRLFETGIGIGVPTPPPGRDYEALYALGYNLYGQARYDEAQKVFQYLVMHHQFDTRYIVALGAALQMLKRHDEAITTFGAAALLDLDDPVPVLHSCECLLALGRTDEAVDGLESVLADCPPGRNDSVRAKAMGLLSLISTTPQAASAHAA
jgi:type III secretion system low calcium response chaperone LcrH/SycD